MSMVYKVAVQQKEMENILEHQLDGTLVDMWISVHLILLSLVWLSFPYPKKKNCVQFYGFNDVISHLPSHHFIYLVC